MQNNDSATAKMHYHDLHKWKCIPDNEIVFHAGSRDLLSPRVICMCSSSSSSSFFFYFFFFLLPLFIISSFSLTLSFTFSYFVVFFLSYSWFFKNYYFDFLLLVFVPHCFFFYSFFFSRLSGLRSIFLTPPSPSLFLTIVLLIFLMDSLFFHHDNFPTMLSSYSSSLPHHPSLSLSFSHHYPHILSSSLSCFISFFTFSSSFHLLFCLSSACPFIFPSFFIINFPFFFHYLSPLPFLSSIFLSFFTISSPFFFWLFILPSFSDYLFSLPFFTISSLLSRLTIITLMLLCLAELWLHVTSVIERKRI